MIQEKLKELRKSNNFNLKEGSKKIGISPTLLYYLETGRNKPTVETIIKICKAYNISADELLNIKCNKT